VLDLGFGVGVNTGGPVRPVKPVDTDLISVRGSVTAPVKRYGTRHSGGLNWSVGMPTDVSHTGRGHDASGGLPHCGPGGNDPGGGSAASLGCGNQPKRGQLAEPSIRIVADLPEICNTPNVFFVERLASPVPGQA
jgi:hypothetical protein